MERVVVSGTNQNVRNPAAKGTIQPVLLQSVLIYRGTVFSKAILKMPTLRRAEPFLVK